LLAVITTCAISLFSQSKKNRHEEGRCQKIISYLRKLHKNDSTAIEVFKNEYRIISRNADQDSLFRKNYVEIIHFFNTKEGENCFCRSNFIIIDPIDEFFLINISTSKRE